MLHTSKILHTLIPIALMTIGLFYMNTVFGIPFFSSLDIHSHAVFSASIFSIGVYSAGIFSIGIFSAGIFSIGIFSIGIFNLAIYTGIGMYTRKILQRKKEKNAI